MKNARGCCWEIRLMHTFVWEFNYKVDKGALLVINHIWQVLGVPEIFKLIDSWFAAIKLPLEWLSAIFIMYAMAQLTHGMPRDLA